MMKAFAMLEQYDHLIMYLLNQMSQYNKIMIF